MSEQAQPGLKEQGDSIGGSFKRWQALSLSQLGYSINLILTLATAALGFALTVVKDKSYAPGCWGKAFMGASLFLLLVSILLGLGCTINRLLSFRHTKNAARIREKRDKRKRERPSDVLSDQARVEELICKLEIERARYQALDDRTWALFWFQTGAFILGIVLLTASFATVYHLVLF